MTACAKSAMGQGAYAQHGTRVGWSPHGLRTRGARDYAGADAFCFGARLGTTFVLKLLDWTGIVRS